MDTYFKTFNELSTRDLYAILKLRNQVFVVEQNCAYQDLDELDYSSFHVMLMDENHLLGYCRILPPDLIYKEPAIGRVVVDSNYRKKDLGKKLMKYSIHKTLELFDNQFIIISAQTYLLKFYTDLEFVATGEEYLEDNIPHVKMKYTKH